LSRARHAAIERQGAVNAEIRAAIMGHDRDNAAIRDKLGLPCTLPLRGRQNRLPSLLAPAPIVSLDGLRNTDQKSAFATSPTDFWRAPKSTNDWRRQEADMTLDDILLKVLARERGWVALAGR
jgi:hypothetical protein